jgi:large subunit ribosomal protein L21
MYGYIEVNGKQYKVKENDRVKIRPPLTQEKLGSYLSFKPLALIDDEGNFIWQPEGVDIQAELIAVGKDKKKLIGKFRHRKRYCIKKSVRTPYSVILIKRIQ